MNKPHMPTLGTVVVVLVVAFVAYHFMFHGKR